MPLLLFKKIILLLVLASFLAVLFFSFPMMMGATDGSMPEGCPFSSAGVSLCPTDTLTMAVHHISAYQSFLTATTHSEMAVMLAYLLLIAFAFLAFFTRLPLFSRPTLLGIAFDSPPADAGERKLVRWLSRFEHSPSAV